MRVGRVVFPRSIARGAELTRTAGAAQADRTGFLSASAHNPEPGIDEPGLSGRGAAAVDAEARGAAEPADTRFLKLFRLVTGPTTGPGLGSAPGAAKVSGFAGGAEPPATTDGGGATGDGSGSATGDGTVNVSEGAGDGNGGATAAATS